MNKSLMDRVILASVVACQITYTTSIAHAEAPPVQFDTPHLIKVKANGLVKTQQIAFMTIKATPEQQKIFMSYNPKTPATLKWNNALPVAANYAFMSIIPVLNQGMHGTCVTFSNTNAINALLLTDKAHSISQLCNLVLGAAFDKSTEGPYAIGYLPSGWNGTYGAYVLEQIERFGVMTMPNEASGSCGGITQYPTDTTFIPPAMSPQSFAQLSSNVMSSLDWSTLISYGQRFSTDPANPYNGANLLNQVKQIIAANNPSKGSRLLSTIGFQLYGSLCDAGACAKKVGSSSSTADTWALTSEISKQTVFPTDGHEVIVFGYDDNAVAIDNNGVAHKGLLTLRNSWGANMGDRGNYYMAYDYFVKFVTEAHEIRTIPFQLVESEK